MDKGLEGINLATRDDGRLRSSSWNSSVKPLRFVGQSVNSCLIAFTLSVPLLCRQMTPLALRGCVASMTKLASIRSLIASGIPIATQWIISVWPPSRAVPISRLALPEGPEGYYHRLCRAVHGSCRLNSSTAFSMDLGLTALGFVGTCIAWPLLSWDGRRHVYLVYLVRLHNALYPAVCDWYGRPGTEWKPCHHMGPVWADAGLHFHLRLTLGPFCYVLLAEARLPDCVVPRWPTGP